MKSRIRFLHQNVTFFSPAEAGFDNSESALLKKRWFGYGKLPLSGIYLPCCRIERPSGQGGSETIRIKKKNPSKLNPIPRTTNGC
jgi:hypothetical protein